MTNLARIRVDGGSTIVAATVRKKRNTGGDMGRRQRMMKKKNENCNQNFWLLKNQTRYFHKFNVLSIEFNPLNYWTFLGVRMNLSSNNMLKFNEQNCLINKQLEWKLKIKSKLKILKKGWKLN